MPESNSYDDLPDWLRKDIDTRLIDPTGTMRFSDLPERVGLYSMFILDLIMELAEAKELEYTDDDQLLLDVLASHKEYWVDAIEEVKSKLASLYRSAIYCGICKKRPFTHSVLRVCRPCYLLHRGEVQLVQVHLHRAKMARVPATLTLGEWVETLKRFDHHCAYCEGPFEVLEHIIPISQGGGTTAENCVPACRACNSKKGGR